MDAPLLMIITNLSHILDFFISHFKTIICLNFFVILSMIYKVVISVYMFDTC